MSRPITVLVPTLDESLSEKLGWNSDTIEFEMSQRLNLVW